jgi:hypothetical protein
MRRLGYEDITDTLLGTGSLYGIFGTPFRDGTKILFAVTSQNSELAGMGELVGSAEYSYSLDTSGTAESMYPYIYTGETPHWTMWKDAVFGSNGRQVPWVYHDGYVRDMIVQAPGEPRIYPMNVTPTSGYGLNGEYRYAYFGKSFCGGGLGGQLATDGNFEAWDDDSTLTNWTQVINGDFYISKDSDNELGGDYCVKMEGAGNIQQHARVRDTLDVDTSSAYNFFVYGKFAVGDTFAAYINVYISPIPAGGGFLSAKQHMDTTTNWTKMDGSFETTDSTDSIEIDIEFQSLAETRVGYIDSFVIQKIEPETYAESYVSHPISAYDEYILHANLLFHGVTVTCDTDDNMWNDISFELFRTKANPSKLDTFWRVAQYVSLTAAELDTLRIIDSIPDDSLGIGFYDSVHIFDDAKRGRGADTVFRMGAPTYIGRNTDTTSCLPHDSLNAIAMVYAITYRDTITGFESDTGRNLYVFYDADDTNFTIGIPPIPAGRDHMIRTLYKGYIYNTPKDDGDGAIIAGVDTQKVYTPTPYADGDGPLVDFIITRIYTPIYVQDTAYYHFYQLAVIKDSSTKSYVDTLPWATLSERNEYQRSVMPTGLNFLSAFGDRMWGADGARIMWSFLDSASRWSAFNDLAINLDDGDGITAIVPDRGHIKIYKNRSQFIVYDNGDGTFNRNWVVDGIGCIAPHSMVAYNNGHAYLSEHGVVYETGLIYKERGGSYQIIASQIEDLLDYTPAENRTAVGAIKNNQYWLSYPDKDTTFVYDFEKKAWAIWSYSFSQATFYDTLNIPYVQPAKDMLFINGNDDRVYKADTTDKDDGTRFAAAWKSGPIGVSYRNKTIGRIGLRVGNSGLGGALAQPLEIYDTRDTGVIYTDTYTLDENYTLYGLEPTPPGTYFHIRLYQVGGLSSTRLFEINGIDLWLRDIGWPMTY